MSGAADADKGFLQSFQPWALSKRERVKSGTKAIGRRYMYYYGVVRFTATSRLDVQVRTMARVQEDTVETRRRGPRRKRMSSAGGRTVEDEMGIVHAGFTVYAKIL